MVMSIVKIDRPPNKRRIAFRGTKAWTAGVVGYGGIVALRGKQPFAGRGLTRSGFFHNERLIGSPGFSKVGSREVKKVRNRRQKTKGRAEM
jgi:hypothetical protein